MDTTLLFLICEGFYLRKGQVYCNTSLYLHRNKWHLCNLPIYVTVISAFKVGEVTQEVKMVDVYQIFFRVLDIPLHKNDGKWAHVADMFEDADDDDDDDDEGSS